MPYFLCLDEDLKLKVRQEAWKARVVKKAKCVVLILLPWTFQPLCGAIAAGCPALSKPSEIVPTFSKLLSELVPKYLDPAAYPVARVSTRRMAIRCNALGEGGGGLGASWLYLGPFVRRERACQQMTKHKPAKCGSRRVRVWLPELSIPLWANLSHGLPGVKPMPLLSLLDLCPPSPASFNITSTPRLNQIPWHIQISQLHCVPRWKPYSHQLHNLSEDVLQQILPLLLHLLHRIKVEFWYFSKVHHLALHVGDPVHFQLHHHLYLYHHHHL
ncbi:hypothetical protein D9611_011805 [Ephemerocybe angulata]|uniref:Uncharacterized protein n=1 Tax=Ephemerocybe angulata TaxID=980116 RepID=A0A8H5BZT3_9AGAR|nr:hypothetical protein D9611_011805 [Tulosesus angulatus]